MTLIKQQIGSPFRPSIAEQHALCDLVNGQGGGGGQQTKRRVRPLDLVRIKNTSGADRSQFDVLGISRDGLLVTPAENAQESLDQRFVYVGKTPVWPEHIGRWAVLVEEIASGAIGWAAMGGMYAAQIEVQHADHDRVDIPDNSGAGGNGKLWSGWQGAGEIITSESGTGTKWATIRLGGWDSPLLDGVAQESIADGASGNVEVEWNGSPSQTIVAWNDHMAGGNAVGNGKDVMVYFHREKGRWSVKELEC